MALTLHLHPLSSYCWKVLIALYETGTPFQPQLVNLGDAAARSAYAALWPTAKIPLLVDGDTVVPETSIMIEHLRLHHPGHIDLLPGDAAQQLPVRLWDRLFDLYVMTPMQQFVGQLLRPEAQRDALAQAAARDGLRLAYGLVESRFGEGPWATGSAFTLADCAAAPALFYAATIEPFAPAHPRLAAYFERLVARDSVQRVIAEARPWFQYFPLRQVLEPRFRDGA